MTRPWPLHVVRCPPAGLRPVRGGLLPESGQNLVFGLTIGILVAVLTGLLLRSTLLPGKSDSMLMEMPDYEWPRPVNVGIKTWQKLKSFVFWRR